MTIVSGGALGIDRAAHLGALRARGKTLVVAPLWCDRAYPAENRRLFGSILAKEGAYLTVSASDAQPIAPAFARRNEVLVALCDVLLLGEAGVPSGTLMAARFARRAGVPQFLLPWSVRALDARGTQSEFARGVPGYFHPVQLVRVLEGRGFDNATYWELSGRAVQARTLALDAKAKLRGRGKKKAGAKKRGAGKQEQKVVAADRAPPSTDVVVVAIAAGATTIDAVAEVTQLGAAAVQHRVLRLTLEGMVLRDGAGLLRVARGMDRQ
jgi:predicted Rossmann fold nucleotide-binding protein DprA/Smf involved in DNA uptake